MKTSEKESRIVEKREERGILLDIAFLSIDEKEESRRAKQQ